MVAFDLVKSQNGAGLIDQFLVPFTVKKYGNEMHARALDPNHFLQGYNYVGPFTEVKLREELHDNIPLNDLDRAAKNHDLAYLKEKEEYMIDHNKNKHIKNIHHADDIFINEAKRSRDDPIMGRISSNLIQKKEQLEKTGLLDTKKFSGFGNDPAEKLRKLVKDKYKNEIRHENKLIKRKRHQTGGLAHLAMVALPALGALAGTVLNDIYSFVKRKISGSGIKMNHQTNKDKKEFLIELFNKI